ncbi:MAG: hypothetical protein UR28_C0009G0005 [Candidatus Peregrinibacteria bacterium GW2011_GWF2_33_10]|nr:MAG: hypothetical protein UR28_C0009G0005 [Candidatus Peregrinibacteria bacterium GW2011_GWF2_33_10]OGJ44724.1 MAG: hypothetical protein A2263_02040 [Candidatus Peregrinibacteria bacterium RIFOXYA2_FULL_33_21]OGJ46763.1 MAG: hypothetical protein A2272_02270 [Candidatus Peregrinibacteria bacterium RIFOXYA12_FULL_33_12]OGJ50590.1 MAG: hypothetical protein A2307_00025 [Candidatus Peregrinibacteria bacterium RIFOXYB2_FULL_33_20]
MLPQQIQNSQIRQNNLQNLNSDQIRVYDKTYTPLHDLYDEATNDAPISDNLQQKMNTPPLDPDGGDLTDQQYLGIIMKMVESKKINLMNQNTLLNLEIYEKLNPQQTVKVDMNTQVIMFRLREIHNLWKSDSSMTYQMKHLITELRQIESRVEQECGNVYVI